MAKVQTFGGSIFEHNCVCTFVHPFINGTEPTNDNMRVDQGCHEKTVDGSLTLVHAKLIPVNNTLVDGRFIEEIFVDKAHYTIVYLDDDSAIEYDCEVALDGLLTNYCIHILSRQPTMDDTKLQNLLDFAQQKLQLNPLAINVHMTLQTGCPAPPSAYNF